MKKGHSLSVLLIVVFFVIFVPSVETGPWDPVASAAPGLHGSANKMLQFKAGGHLLGFQPKKVYFASLDHALSVEFLGTPGVMPKTAAGGRETGKESKVSSLGRVVYEELWEGISLTYEAREEGGIAESTYRIGPWADVSKIRLGYNVPVEVQRDGSLKFKFDRGYLTESPPEAWQEIGGERVLVEVAFRVTGGEVGFSVGPYDPNYPLTIDPTYAWHTFYGSSDWDEGQGIATDKSGNVYVTGDSHAPWNGPTGESPLHAYSGGVTDIFVLKLDSSGAYQWHTFYGSSSNDFFSYAGIATDASGNVYVMGSSDATWNGPSGQSPLHAYSGGDRDIFVLKLDSSGAYQWHTFYGSSDYDYGYAIATDGSGNVYVTGGSNATWNGPTGQSPLHAYSGGFDIFILKLDSSGSYQWHTFYGSSGADHGWGIATDGSGNVYVTGYSNATWNGPAGQSPLHAYSGGICDIFVLKLDSSGAYQWHTFYGASDDDYGDYSYGIATDGRGNVYVTGGSYAWNGPAGQSPLHAYSGLHDIFVLKLSGAPIGCDFNGDSLSDLAGLTSNGNIWFTTDLQTWTYIPGVLAQQVGGDFNGDGHSDLAGLTSTGQIYYTTDLQTWTHIPGTLSQLVVGDFNRDGHSDLAGLTSTDQIYYTIDLQTWTQIPGVLSQLVVGDFDGDGKSDLAGITSNGYIFYTTDLQTWTQIPGVLSQLVVGDFNGDGHSDLAGLTSAGQIYYTIDLQNWTYIPGVLSELVE